MRYTPDRSVKRVAGGSILIGGSPLRLFRLSAPGSRFVDRLVGGDDVEPVGAQTRLVDRLVDAGAMHPRPAPATGAEAAAVTVVIPVRDRVSELDRLLASIGARSMRGPAGGGHRGGRRFARPGRVARVAGRHGAGVVRRDVPGGPAMARNRGLAVVETPLVAFLDSDTVVTAGWLAASWVSSSTSGWRWWRCVSGPRRAPESWRGTTRPGRHWISVPDPGRVSPRTRIAYVPAAALLARTEVLRSSAGSTADLLVGEDVDLVWRAVAEGWRVRYEPAAEVVHDVRPTGRAWIRQRFDYGTSAAVLDERHPGSVAPVSASGWTLGAWALVVAGHPIVGVAVATGSAAALPRRLPGVPFDDALMLAVRGHLGAGRLLARALVRVWWPVAVVAALVSRRARRVLMAGVAAVALDAIAEARPAGLVGAGTVGALSVVDDVAYGAGVWAGCVRRRSGRALLPSISNWPSRSGG